ncbi:hypothetical protein TorRG33x02_202330 [Trema orientale]|uniref:Uncharacterized protein n=1 Tax=Trema orientale TaxID=63057 RepID=A0A2P5EEG2_TREOI|nr:hypothetical protein TorRG33x02_202330 [Trema orientale]
MPIYYNIGKHFNKTKSSLYHNVYFRQIIIDFSHVVIHDHLKAVTVTAQFPCKLDLDQVTTDLTGFAFFLKPFMSHVSCLMPFLYKMALITWFPNLCIDLTT